MKSRKQIKAIKAKNAMDANELYGKKGQKRSYQTAQLFLKNRKFKPYPNGRGGVSEVICKKCNKKYGKILDEQEKLHSLNFWGKIRKIQRKEGTRWNKK